MVASKRSDIKGVIGIVPSNVVWQAQAKGFSGINKSSWTLNGKELPYLNYSFSFSFMRKFFSNSKGLELREVLKTIYTADKSKMEPAIIKVEKINGPILLIAGKDDKRWPSYYMCQMIENRLDILKFEHPVVCLFYDNVGHQVCTPHLMPTIDYKYQKFALGGKDAENANAQIDSWNKIIGFLQTYFPIE